MERKILGKLYKLSIKASNSNETPVSAVIVCDNKIIAKAYNKRNKSNLTIDHAEIKVIQKANKKLKTWRLNNCSLYVTIKPCVMCESIIREARIKKVYYLLEKNPNKKQFSKTEFVKLDSDYSKIIKEKYLENISTFWNKLRNKK